MILMEEIKEWITKLQSTTMTKERTTPFLPSPPQSLSLIRKWNKDLIMFFFFFPPLSDDLKFRCGLGTAVVEQNPFLQCIKTDKRENSRRIIGW